MNSFKKCLNVDMIYIIHVLTRTIHLFVLPIFTTKILHNWLRYSPPNALVFCIHSKVDLMHCFCSKEREGLPIKLMRKIRWKVHTKRWVYFLFTSSTYRTHIKLPTVNLHLLVSCIFYFATHKIVTTYTLLLNLKIDWKLQCKLICWLLVPPASVCGCTFLEFYWRNTNHLRWQIGIFYERFD